MYVSDEPDHIRLLRETLRRFVAEEMPKERVRQWDRQHRFPRELFHKLAGLGVCGLIGMPIVGGSSNMQKNNIANRLGLAG